MKRNKLDIFLIIGLILIAIISWVVIDNFVLKEGDSVQIVVDGKVTNSFPLNEDYIYSVKNDENRIIIKDNQVYMEDANCRDRLCVKQGKISKAGEAIICLPHKLVVKIVSKKEVKLDAISK